MLKYYIKVLKRNLFLTIFSLVIDVAFWSFLAALYILCYGVIYSTPFRVVFDWLFVPVCLAIGIMFAVQLVVIWFMSYGTPKTVGSQAESSSFDTRAGYFRNI